MRKVEDDKLLTKKEVVEYLRVAHQTLEKLMKQKQISFIKLDRKVLFKQSDVDEFIESKRILAKSDVSKKKKTR